MARPRNLERRGAIELAAHRLFVSTGYSQASYSDIAEASAVDRSLVQYYFPRKAELLVSFLNRVLALAEVSVRERGLDSGGGFTTLFRIGEAYFAFLLQNEARRRLALETFSSREITSELVFLNFEWVTEYLEVPERDPQEIEEDFDLVVGGAYELCYRHLNRGENVKSAALVHRMLLAFMTLSGIPPEESEQTLAASALEERDKELVLQEIATLLEDDGGARSS